MRISDWSSDVCSSDLLAERDLGHVLALVLGDPFLGDRLERVVLLDLGFRQRDLLLMRGVEPRRDQPARLLTPAARVCQADLGPGTEGQRAVFLEIAIIEAPELRAVGSDKKIRSEEHTSELQSLM